MTYRTDLFRQAGINKLPTSLAEFTAAAKKLGARNNEKTFSPVYIAGTDWYVAMSFVYDHGGKIAITNKGKWIGTLDRPKAIAGLTAFKSFFDAASRASKTTDETRPNPYDVYAQGNAASMIGPGWFSCCVGDHKAATAQFVMPSRTKGQPMPGLPRRLRPGRPGRCRQGEGRGLDPRVHRQRLDDRAAGEGQHPEHDEPARVERQRASGPPELVRPDREALGQRGEWEHPPHHAGADPHQQDDASRRRPRSPATTSPSR